jgi:hypothetical protein
MEVKYQARIAQLELQRVVQQLRARIVHLERQLNSKHRWRSQERARQAKSYLPTCWI